MLGIPSARYVDCQRFPVFYFSVQYPKKYRESSSCGLFEAEHTKRDKKKTFSTPERYDEHHRPFYMKSPSPSPGIVYPLGDLFNAYF